MKTISFNVFLSSLMGLMPVNLLAADFVSSQYNNQIILPTPQSIRDPFTPSELMFNTVGNQPGSLGTSGYGFMRSPSASNIPKMRLRGFVEQDPNNPVALLEVAGVRTYLVQEGDEINIDPAVPNSAIRIAKITRLSVTVEAGTLGSIRVQR